MGEHPCKNLCLHVRYIFDLILKGVQNATLDIFKVEFKVRFLFVPFFNLRIVLEKK
jgi:hypothetical protein